MTSLALALDTSTPVLSCALLEHDARALRILATRASGPPVIVSTLVPSLFDEMLCEAGRTFKDLSLLVAGLGPGLFTGTRVALATMKAIAYARKLPLAGAGSLEAMALAAARGESLRAGDELPFETLLDSGWLCPVLDARKGEVYFAVHRFRRGQLETQSPPRAARPKVVVELLASSASSPKPIGAGVNVLGAGLTPQEPLFPGAAEIAYLALQRDREPTFDLARVLALEPTYLRPPEAEVARQKRELSKGL